MDVPFVSSGALSRAHYTLVRKIESAASIQSSNQLLISEIKSRQEQFSRPALSHEQCKESLIVLLYCHMTIAHGFLSSDAFDFAMPHAIGLAEAGQRLDQKRIGYLFCAEIMPPTHELQLMLVNTLRKDLESDSIPRICLALDNVIVSYNDDLVPAIQSRLHDLLSHTSPHVRRRALLAFSSLSRRNPELLTRISGNVMKCLESPYQSVVSAALVVSSLFSEAEMSPVVKSSVNGLLKKSLADIQGHHQLWYILRTLRTLLSLGLIEENIPVVLELICSSSLRTRAVLRGAFSLFSMVSRELLLSSAKSGLVSAVESLRPLLISRNPNDQYLFLVCLECVDPAAWSGNSPGIPSVLEAWEVERVMQLLQSADSLIRKTTIKLLNRIDPAIISSYYTQALDAIPSITSVISRNDHAVRILELVETKSGELYAQEVINLLVQLENVPLGGDFPVVEPVVEGVLLCLRNAHFEFQTQCATTLLTFALESKLHPPQTLMVIVTALVVEYCGKLSISPSDMLQGLAIRLPSCIPSIQDACLLSMLRISANCDEVPAQIIDTVTSLKQTSKRHVRQRCDQFLTYIHEKPILSAIVKSARTSSLPDFIEALYSQPTLSSQPILPFQPASSSHELPTVSKLRYQAYDAPSPVAKLRGRHASDVHYPASSALSDGADSNSPLGSTHALPRTATAGELTLTSGMETLELKSKLELEVNKHSDDREQSHRADLIAFDSTDIIDGAEFEKLWSKAEGPMYNSRGWCEASVENVVRLLQELESVNVEVIPANVGPFIGDVKIIVRASGEAVIRLGKSEDDSCLWWVKSTDGVIRERVARQIDRS